MSNHPINRTLRYALLAVFIGVPLANFGLQPLLSDGSQFADDPETRVATAGYAFAIWGVIFTGMLWFAGNLTFGNEPDSPSLRKAIVCLMIAGLASIAFVPLSIYCNATIVWIDIMAHLIPLALAAVYLRKHVNFVSSSEPETAKVSSLSRWSFFGPSMYFGWISAASVISTSLMANELGIELGDSVATAITIAMLVGLGSFAAWMVVNGDPIYGGTVCWALIAVGVKQQAFPLIQYVAWGVAAIVAVVLISKLIGKRRAFFASRTSPVPATA